MIEKVPWESHCRQYSPVRSIHCAASAVSFGAGRSKNVSATWCESPRAIFVRAITVRPSTPTRSELVNRRRVPGGGRENLTIFQAREPPLAVRAGVVEDRVAGDG